MPIYVPKRIIPVKTAPAAPLFFLAGPIRGGGDWQYPMARELLQRNTDAHIVVPSRWSADHPLHDYFVAPFTPADNRQLHWERHYMEQAVGLEGGYGCLIFWFGLESELNPHPGPEPYAMDTRRETGKYTGFMKAVRRYAPQVKLKMVVGGSRDYFGLDVILDELADAVGMSSFPFYKDMGELADAAYEMAVS